VIQRICAVSLVVLIVMPFTAPFATFDLCSPARGDATQRIDTVAAATQTATQDDAPAWFERSGHHAMVAGELGCAPATLSLVFNAASPTCAVAPPSLDASALAAVLRV
jgi:hypothetical protein